MKYRQIHQIDFKLIHNRFTCGQSNGGEFDLAHSYDVVYKLSVKEHKGDGKVSEEESDGSRKPLQPSKV